MIKGEEKKMIAITTGSWARLVLAVLVAYALFLVHDFLLVIVASIVIASAVEPAAVWARKRNFPRLPTILAVYVSAALVLVGLFYFILLPLLGETVDFIRNLPVYSEAVSEDADVSSLVGLEGVLGQVPDSFSVEEIVSYLNSLVSSVSRGVFSSVSFVFGGVLSSVLIVVLSFYLAVQDDGVGKFLKIITPIKHEKYVIGLWRRSQAKIGLWMQGQLLLVVIIAVLTYLGLLLIGIPHALLLAMMAGVFEIIPLFGPVLAAIPALFVAYAFGGFSTALVVAGLFLIIQQFENHLIYPLVVKKVVGVPPMVSILALVVGGHLAGFLGVLISVPVAAAVMEFISDVERDKQAQLEAEIAS